MSALAIRGAKSSGESAHTPVESPDSLINTSYAVMLDAISEGPIVGLVNGAQSIYFDQTPLANPDGSLNYSSVTWESRTGEADQDYIAGFPAVEAETSVGVQLTFAQSWTQAISNTQLSAVRVRLGVSVLYTTETDGDTVGAVVNYAIDLSTNNGDYVTVVSQAFNGKTTNGYQRTHRIDLPASAGGWRIRVRRLTADSVSGTQAVTSIVGYTEIVDAKLQYPYTALVGTKIDASQFSSIPERAFRIRGRIIQVPTNYEPSTRGYSGTWDGTFKLAWTDNPAWVFRDLILNDRYGLGQVIKADQVDKWSLYQIAQYCDALVDDGKGATEPRFTCNLYLQSRANALQVLQDLASVFRGMSYYAGTEVMVSADMPSDPVYTYTNANVINGKFSRAASSGTTRYSVCKVSWSDTENFGNVRTEYVTRQEALARYGVRETEITAFACTSQGQAQRLGQYTLLTNQLETDTISFSVGLDGTIARPGQLIRVADEFYGGKPMGGRIKSATTTTVTLDNDIEAAAGDTLVVILPTGTAETRVVQSLAGRVVTVSQAFSAVPTAQSIYNIETAELVAETYRILTVAENFGDDKLQYDVVAVQHNASKFAAIDNGAQIVTPPTSVLPNAVQAIPTNIALSTFDAVKQGVNVATMRITWDAPAGAVYYNVWWRRGASDWINAGVTYTASIEVAGIYTDTYTARVSAVGVTGNSSLWGYSPATALQGKTGTPPAVSTLTATSQLFGIALAWTFPAGAEDTQRTEIWYGKTPSLDAAAKLSDLAYPQRDYVLQNLQAGATFFFWARLVDRTGNIGPFYPVGNGVMGQSSAEAGPILDMIAGQIDETALGQDLKDRIDLIDGPPGLPGSVNDRLNELGTQVTAVTDQLQDQIDAIGDIVDALEYDPAKTYAQGESVRVGQRLYQASQAVPVNTAPPNATYWLDVGQIVSDSNGLSARVTTTETKITSIEGVNTAQGTAITGLQTSLNGKADASALQTLTTRVTSAEGTISSQGTAITGLQNSVAGKADASTVAALSNTVTQQGTTITAQGAALTSISATVGGIGGNGANLVPSAYSWLASSTLPTMVNSAAVSTLAVAVADAMSGFGYASTVSDTNTGRYVILAPANNAANWNLSLEVGSYILSFYASSSAATQRVSAGVWSGTGRLGSQVTLTTTRARYSFVFSVVSAGKAAPIIYLSQAGISGLTLTYDSVMIERQIGTNTAPSAFVAGPTAAAVAGQAAATSALDARVTQTETGLTTQGSQITSLTNSVAGKADNSALQSLASTVSQQGTTLTSQGTAVTQLQSTIGGIAGAGTNLLSDDYSWLTSTTLPTTVANTLTRLGVAVAAASSGYGIKMTLGSAVTTQYLMLSPSNNAAGYNIDMEAGSYLVSMYVQGSVAGSMRISMYNGSHRYSSTVAYTTDRQRLVFVCTAAAAARAAITIYPNMSGLAAGTEIIIDSVMIEEQIGTATTPSAFVAGPSARAISAQATAISTLDTRVTQTETTITAQATRLDGLYVQLNPAAAGDTGAYAGATTLFAGVWSEQSARIEAGIATSKRVDTVQASVTDTSNGLAQTNATVQQTSQAIATLDGKVSATWSVKLQVNANGQYVAAGIGLGIENTDAGLQSQFLVSADRFAVVTSVAGGASFVPFAVQGGQVFLGSTFIQDGTITNAKIGSYISSTNYVAGQQGWILNKDGTLEINGVIAGQGRLIINAQNISVYDANNVLRVRLGNLG